MKVLSVAEAHKHFAAVCAEALDGEVIRLDLGNGALLELRSVLAPPAVPGLSAVEMANGYHDTEWAAFENHCGKASD